MSHEFLEDRRRALEEAFFAKQNQQLIQRLKQEREHENRVHALRAVSAIHDDDLLERLVALGLRADTMAALLLVPLVEVAWANGEVMPAERSAVLQAAHDNGIELGSSAAQLLEEWLQNRPSAELLASWKEYIAQLCAELGGAAKESLKNEVMGKALKVAESAGGFLGAASVSGKESDKLWELEHAFR